MSRRRGGRGMLVVGLVLLVFLVLVDLFRPDSVILGALDDRPDVGQPEETREQRMLRVMFPGGSRR